VVSAVLLIGLVSATPLQEFMSHSDLTVTMTQDSTTSIFSMNTAGLSFDNQNIPLPNGVTINGVSISGLLNGILTLRADLSDGATYPVFSNVQIQQNSVTSLILDNLFSYMGYSFTTSGVNADNSILTTLSQQNSLGIPAQGNSYFVKNGNTYTFGYDGGFGAVQSYYKNKIGEAITRGVNSMNLQDMISQELLPIVSLDDYLPVLQNLGYNVNSVDFTNAILENTGYSTSVDLTTLAFQDGTYKIPVTITPLTGDTTPTTKTITLVLSGIVNEVEETTTSNTYIPSDFGIKEIIKSIVGLPTGTIVAIQVSDDKPVIVNVLSQVSGLKYLIIDTDQQPAVNAQISFSIDKSKVSHSNKVSLYVWEPTTSRWEKLVTTFVADNGAEYEYTATTPHFSTFMVGEDTTPSSSRSSRTGMTTLIEGPIVNPPAVTNEPNPINLKTPTQEGFFARLGRFFTTLTGGVISSNDAKQNSTIGVAALLTFLIALVGIALIAVRARR